METFAVDKCFYDIGTNDLRELWDADLDPVSFNYQYIANLNINTRLTIKQHIVGKKSSINNRVKFARQPIFE